MTPAILEDLWHTNSEHLDAEPFVVVCLKHGEVEEAKKYVPYLSIDDRFECAMRCKDWQVAAETAIKQCSLAMLMKVEAACNDQATLNYLKRHRGKCHSL